MFIYTTVASVCQIDHRNPGIIIGKDGEMSFYAELEKAGALQKEFVDFNFSV